MSSDDRMRADLVALGVNSKPTALDVPFPARGADGRVRLLVWRAAETVRPVVRDCHADGHADGRADA